MKESKIIPFPSDRVSNIRKIGQEPGEVIDFAEERRKRMTVVVSITGLGTPAEVAKRYTQFPQKDPTTRVMRVRFSPSAPEDPKGA